MMKCSFQKLSAVVAVVIAAFGPAAIPAMAVDRPNILFILADDQCFETISQFGLTNIETPNLDRLARQGTTFTHAYNMGSWCDAVCVASRHMLNTGAFVWKAQAISNQLGSLGNQEKKQNEETCNPWPNFQENGWMWSQLMAAAGYDTYFTGKWHVLANAEKIFKVAAHVRGGMPNQTPEGYNRPIEGQPDKWSPYNPNFGGYWEGGRHWSEVVADDTIGFLDQAKEADNPFFMYIAFNSPHDPRQAPKEYVDMYPLDRIEMPVNFLPEYPYKDKIDCSEKLRDEQLAPFPRTEYAVKVNRQEYYAIITHMDAQIGRILDALDSTGQTENTWIFFTADHGLAVGHHGLMGKQNLFDHSVRVPLMIVAPGVEAGQRIDAPVYFQDIMPTTLELADATKPEHVQFQSLIPVLAGESNSYDAIYGGYLKSQRSVVVGPYKLLLFPNVPKVQLFNVKEDPHEMKNLADDPKMEPRIAELFGILLELQEETGDTLDLKSPFRSLPFSQDGLIARNAWVEPPHVQLAKVHSGELPQVGKYGIPLGPMSRGCRTAVWCQPSQPCRGVFSQKQRTVLRCGHIGRWMGRGSR